MVRGRWVAAPLRPAQHYIVILGGLQIERGIAHARGDHESQPGQAREQGTRKRRAFAHRADDLEILQRGGSGLLRGKGLVEYGDIDAICDLRPVRDIKGQIEIVVENCTAQPRHGKVRSWR
jgi:hypothetical protein